MRVLHDTNNDDVVVMFFSYACLIASLQKTVTDYPIIIIKRIPYKSTKTQIWTIGASNFVAACCLFLSIKLVGGLSVYITVVYDHLT